MSVAPFVYSDKVAGPAGLKNLIQNGPSAAALAPMVTAGNWPGIANSLNDKNGTGSGLVSHSDVQPGDLNAIMDWGEVRAAVNPSDVQIWQGMLSQSPVKIGSSGVQGFINAVFATCTTTLAALKSFFTQQGSLIEVECGTGVQTSNIDVQYAMTGSGPGNSWGL